MTVVLTSLAESCDFAGSIDVEISDPPSRIDRIVAETPYDLLLDGESVIVTFHQSEDESRRSTATIVRDATAPRKHFPAGGLFLKVDE